MEILLRSDRELTALDVSKLLDWHTLGDADLVIVEHIPTGIRTVVKERHGLAPRRWKGLLPEGIEIVQR